MNNLVEERKPAVKGRTQGELPRDVSNLVNKTFQGIRAVYAVGHQCVVLHGIGLNYVFELFLEGMDAAQVVFGSCSLSISCALNNVFSPGLQVWSTASGKEQDQDKDTFPRSDSFNFVSMLFLGLVNWYFVVDILFVL